MPCPKCNRRMWMEPTPEDTRQREWHCWCGYIGEVVHPGDHPVAQRKERAMENHVATRPVPERTIAALPTADGWLAQGKELLASLIGRVQDVEHIKRQAEQTRAALLVAGATDLAELPWRPAKVQQISVMPRRPWTAEDDETLLRLTCEGVGAATIGKKMGRHDTTIRNQQDRLRKAGRL